MKIFQITIAILFSLSIYSQKPAYVIYNAKGKKVSYKKMIKNLNQKDIILFGELHNNAIAHWLELEVTKDIHKNKTVTLGAEMLEADNQTQLTNYVNGVSDAKTLDTVARLWPNYNTDYAPLVNYAKKNKLHFIATNIPRRYANLVYKKGFKSLDTLSAQEKEWIAPLPITFDSELPTYKNILKMMGDHGTPELVMAQAIKDATMAHFILKNYKANTTFIHYNGAYHSNNYEGILWYLKNENNTLNYATISTVNQEDLTKLKEKHLNIADYIICVDADMTTTY
ncbi:ChaN family lipoprotein [Cellulophaga lytica]|uniref:ChaN family lipoprotein n=1 Tax=Cellulophaga lytica TaxID=979 RepID=UPI0026E28A01|nr:ChaN family lipoprotein [Cellulophaga lytica]MDO6855072.1 ChaN family lipoprotein [Cellulophaga lytica]